MTDVCIVHYLVFGNCQGYLLSPNALTTLKDFLWTLESVPYIFSLSIWGY